MAVRYSANESTVRNGFHPGAYYTQITTAKYDHFLYRGVYVHVCLFVAFAPIQALLLSFFFIFIFETFIFETENFKIIENLDS